MEQFDEKKWYAENAIKANVRAAIMRAGLRPFCSDPKNAEFVKTAFDETEYAEQYAVRATEQYNEKFAEVAKAEAVKKEEQEEYEKKMLAAGDAVVRDMVIRDYLANKQEIGTLDAFDSEYPGIEEEKKNEDNK